MTNEENRRFVLALIEEALDWFRAELERHGRKKSPSPSILMMLAPKIIMVVPLEDLGEPNGKMTIVICHFLLQELEALNYVYVTDVRAKGRSPKGDVHCYGGFPGWDAATTETYRFDGRRVLLVERSEVKDSTGPKTAHLTMIPNLYTKVMLTGLSPAESDRLRSIARMWAKNIREDRLEAEKRNRVH